MPAITVIKLRRDTAANWASTNPVLAAGEAGLETDTDLVKYGDGTSTWTALQYPATSRVSQLAKNDTGASVTKGQVVYVSGANGSNALFSLADADTEATSSKTVGLLAQDLLTNGIGSIITEGLLTGIDTSAATVGQSVWLSSTAGGRVYGAPPAKPAHGVYLGVVTRAHANQGSILVKVQNGYELNELHDVNAGSPSTGDALVWNGTAWVNQQVDVSGAISTHNSDTTDVHGIADTSLLATKAYADNAAATAAAAIVDAAPGTLNTLNELAAAINDDASYAATMTTALGNKQDKVAGVSDTEIGYLANVTSDIQAQIDAAGGGEPATLYTLGTVYGETTDGWTGKVALGYESTASADEAIAIGARTVSSANHAIAVGMQATASGLNSIAIGVNTAPTAEESIAIGSRSDVGAISSIAIGPDTVISATNVSNSIAIGQSAYIASGAYNSMAIGANSVADSRDTIVLGDPAITKLKVPGLGLDTSTATDGQTLIWSSTGGYGGTGGFEWGAAGGAAATSTALGTVYGNTDAFDSTAIGYEAIAAAASTAIGNMASANHLGSIAIGRGSYVTANNQIVIGTDAWSATPFDGTITIGNSSNTTLAIPGVGLRTDLANNGQYLTWSSNSSVTGGPGFEWAYPQSATPSTKGVVDGLTHNVNNNVVFGFNPSMDTYDIGSSNVLIGESVYTANYGVTSASVVVGNGAGVSANGLETINGSNAVAVGSYANAQDNSVAIGSSAVANGNATAVGTGASAYSSFSIAVGAGAVASSPGEIVIGTSAQTSLKIPGIGIDTTTAANGQVLVWNSTAGGSGTGAFEWASSGPASTEVSENTTLVPGKYFVTAASKTLTLPASPSLGDEIKIFDSTSTGAFTTLNRNNNKINGVADNYYLNVSGFAVTLTWTGTTNGWRLTNAVSI